MTVDEYIYVFALKSCTDMEKDAELATTPKEKRRVVMKYINTIPKRAKTGDFSGDMNLWTSSAIGIGMYMLEFIESFAKQNGIEYAPTV